jgi:hypothetical protein
MSLFVRLDTLPTEELKLGIVTNLCKRSQYVNQFLLHFCLYTGLPTRQRARWFTGSVVSYVLVHNLQFRKLCWQKYEDFPFTISDAGVHFSSSYFSVGTWRSVPRCVELTTHPPLLPRLNIGGTAQLLSLYVFISAQRDKLDGSHPDVSRNC